MFSSIWTEDASADPEDLEDQIRGKFLPGPVISLGGESGIVARRAGRLEFESCFKGEFSSLS